MPTQHHNIMLGGCDTQGRQLLSAGAKVWADRHASEVGRSLGQIEALQAREVAHAADVLPSRKGQGLQVIVL